MSRRTAIALVVLATAALIAIPYLATPFFFVQVIIRSLWLGTVAASLTFLIRYAGMISLAQTAIYGVAGYVTANFSVVRGVDPWVAAGLGLLTATVLALAIGAISARARGVYFLMITLAAGVFVYYFALQYRPFTLGFGGINGVQVPDLGNIPLRDPENFYYFSAAVSLLALAILYLYARSPLGLALQGDRDCPERMTALGLNPIAVRITGFAAAGLVAGMGGVLSVWFNGQVSPGSLDIVRTINILIIAVLGGATRIEGAWLGAFLMTLLSVYVSDVTAYYNTVIGLVFIAVVVFSPEGALGLATRLGKYARTTLSATAGLRRTTPAITRPKEN